jgi:hypothetical protein
MLNVTLSISTARRLAAGLRIFPWPREAVADQGSRSTGSRAALRATGEADGTRIEIGVEDLDQLLLYRDSAIRAAFAADVDYAALVSRADVTNIGAEQFLGTQSGQERR